MCKLGQEGGAPIGRSGRGTNLEERYDSLRKVVGSAVNLALIPFRAPGALYRFFSETLIHYEQQRAWDRNVKGTWLDPASRDDTDPGGLIPDPRRFH